MGKSILELFESEPIGVTNKPAKEVYSIQSAKSEPLTSVNPLINATSMRVFNKLRLLDKNIKSETAIEQELTGIRQLRFLSSPILYGHEILRITTGTTRSINIMQANINNDNKPPKIFTNVTNAINKIASKVGIKFSHTVLPTEVSDALRGVVINQYRTTFASMNGKGNAMGDFIKNIASSNTNDIKSAIIGSATSALRNAITSGLRANFKDGDKSETNNRFTSVYSYSAGDGLQKRFKNMALSEPDDEKKITKSILNIYDRNTNGGKISGNVDLLNKSLSNTLFKAVSNPNKSTIRVSNKKYELTPSNTLFIKAPNYTGDGSNEPVVSITEPNTGFKKLKYQKEIKFDFNKPIVEQYDKFKEGDLNNGESNLYTFDNSFKKNGKNYEFYTYFKKYGDSLKSNISIYTSYDNSIGSSFVSLKKYKTNEGKKNDNDAKNTGETKGFLAAITDISDSLTSDWSETVFAGSPLKNYKYGSVGRTIGFTLNLYATNAIEHSKMWKDIRWLQNLTRPSSYTEGIAIPNIIIVNVGGVFIDIPCALKSVSLSIQDEAGWINHQWPINSMWYTGIKEGANDKNTLPVLCGVQLEFDVLNPLSTTNTFDSSNIKIQYNGQTLKEPPINTLQSMKAPELKPVQLKVNIGSPKIPPFKLPEPSYNGLSDRLNEIKNRPI